MESRPVLYVCDPEKNTECKKTFCQLECTRTTKREYAATRDGNPILAVADKVDEGISIVELFDRLEALQTGHRPDGGYYQGVRDSIRVVKEALGYGDE